MTAQDLLHRFRALLEGCLLGRHHTDVLLADFRPIPEPLARRGALGYAGGAPGLNIAAELDLDTGVYRSQREHDEQASSPATS